MNLDSGCTEHLRAELLGIGSLQEALAGGPLGLSHQAQSQVTFLFCMHKGMQGDLMSSMWIQGVVPGVWAPLVYAGAAGPSGCPDPTLIPGSHLSQGLAELD